MWACGPLRNVPITLARARGPAIPAGSCLVARLSLAVPAMISMAYVFRILGSACDMPHLVLWRFSLAFRSRLACGILADHRPRSPKSRNLTRLTVSRESLDSLDEQALRADLVRGSRAVLVVGSIPTLRALPSPGQRIAAQIAEASGYRQRRSPGVARAGGRAPMVLLAPFRC